MPRTLASRPVLAVLPLASLALAACTTLPHAHRSPPAPSVAGWSQARPAVEREEALSGAAQEDARERPGLGTEWGESRWSPVHEVEFARGSDRPWSVATLYYNDRAGVEAMASHDRRRGARLDAPVSIGPGISVSLVDERGCPLAALSLGGRVYVVGEAGRRYGVLVRNDTGQRVEVVLSVDGLDAIDGRPADLDKRGYLVGPFDTLTVDGFRRSSAEVAAFRFGSVRDSYAARTGDGRDVGVVGVALFTEQRDPWDDEEIERRQGARPFSDSRFAAPPPGWW